MNTILLYSFELNNNSFPKGFRVDINETEHKNKKFYDIWIYNEIEESFINDNSFLSTKMRLFEQEIPERISNISSDGTKTIREITLEEIIAIVNTSLKNSSKVKLYCLNFLKEAYWADYYPDETSVNKKSA